MSCALALVAAFALSPAQAAAGTAPPMAVSSTAPALTSEPLFAEIVSRAQSLEARAAAWDAAQADAFRSDLARLSALDLQGHQVLAARGTDDDLKCMLRGMSEDLPRRMSAVDAALDDAARTAALQELRTTLSENAGVVAAPTRPPV